jgi:precorrin-2 dehydrogenase/sirohydrochlorin ferrochelatase
MLPIILDPAKVRVGIAGSGEPLRRRLRTLEAAGIRPEPVGSADNVWPLDVLFIAGPTIERARALAGAAQAVGVLVNVEDEPELCDFHLPAIVRRGDLLLTVSTGGRAPGLARAVRARIESMFGEEWGARAQEIIRLRGRWRWQGLAPQEVSARVQAHLTRRGWLA